jgi:stearoyl-CoA desaturase (delta-9 desaturase)
VERGQIDLSAGAIRVFERCGWVTDVKWPTPEKLALRKIVLDSTK